MPSIRIHHLDNYTVFSNSILQDPNISLKAIGLWAKCMSRPTDWEYNIAELAKSGKERTTAIRSAINELIKHGLAIRYQKISHEKKDPKKKGKKLFAGMDYVFFSKKLSPEEIKAYEEELKKSFPQSGFPHAEFPHAENQPLQSKYKTNSSSFHSEEIKKEEKRSVPSAEASELSSTLLQTIRKTKENFKEPNLKKWAIEIDRMLRIDKIDADRIRAILNWLPTHDFWRINILSPEKLRLQIDKLELEMQKHKKDSRIEINKRFVFNLKNEHPDDLKHIKINRDYAINIENNKDVMFDMNPESFKKTFMHIAGIRYVED